MGQIHNIEKLTDCKFLNLYHLNATSIHNTPVSYFVASRAKTINELKIKTGKNTPDGVVIYSLYGEKKDRVVLVLSLIHILPELRLLIWMISNYTMTLMVMMEEIWY